MSDQRRFGRINASVRAVIGTAVAVAVTALVVSAVSAPWPVVAREAPSVTALPEAADAVLACSGPLLAIGRTVENALQISAAAGVSATAGAAEGEPAPSGSSLSAPRVEAGGPAAYVAPPVGERRANIAAATSARVASEDVAGFAAAACRAPLMEEWLVGGQNTTGSSDILLLANPGDVTATVQLTVFGAQGAQTPPGASDIIVQAGTQVALPLAAVSGEEQQPVIRVTASGAPVTSSLQSSLVRTLVPGGVDVQNGAGVAAMTQVIAGITIAQEASAVSGQPANIVRVLAPDAAASATVTVTSAATDGAGASGAAFFRETLALTAEIPLELDLGDLTPGDYTIVVEANAPVVAAAFSTTGFGDGSDFAWYTPSPALTGATLFAVPDGPQPRLVLSNRGANDASVTLTGQAAGARTVPVPAGQSVAIAVSSESLFTLDVADAPGVFAAVTFSGATELAGIPVWPGDADAQAVRVFAG